MITKEMLKAAAKKKGLTNTGQMETDYFQDLFLYHIYKKTNLLVFKGGTCLYKLYNLPRFSEDLDFTMTGDVDIEKLISDIAGKTGSEIKSTKRIKNSLLVKIGFKGIITNYNTLRIDITSENIVFGYDVVNYVSPYIDISPFSLRVLNLKEIIAEKIHAILAREKARDLYDLFFLLRFTEPDKDIIEKKLKIFNMSFDADEFRKKATKLKDLWVPEMKPFVLTESVSFEVARDFVCETLAKIQNGHKP